MQTRLSHLLALLLFGGGLSLASVQGQLPPEIKDRLTHATVYIETQLTMASRDWAVMPKEGQEKIGQRPSEPASGSGFIITEDGYVITNAHVVQGLTYLMTFDGKNANARMIDNNTRPKPFDPESPTEPFTIQFNASAIKVVVDSGLETEKVYNPSIVRIDSEIDLALLKISGTEDFVALALAPDFKVESGTRAIMTGFPGGAAPDVIPFLKESNASLLKNKNPRMSLNMGTVSSVREHDEETRYQLAIGANHGNSGGPISNAEGDVIGILYAGIDGMNNITYAIPAKYIGDVCTTSLKSKLGLEGSGDEDSEESGDDEGEQSFDEFLDGVDFDFGDKKK